MPLDLGLSQKPSSWFARRAAGLCSMLAVLLCFAAQANAASTTVVISQLYGGGGNTGAPYANDYVELFNLSAAPVSLSGYSLQYFSATGTSVSGNVALPSVTLQPGQHYLVQLAAGTTVTTPLPVTADYSNSSINMSGTTGRIYLASSITPLAGACSTSATIVDFVGYGTSVTCFEGSRGPAPSNATALGRTNQCVDTDQNGSDFAVITPSPRNSTSTITPCSGATAPPISSVAATPASVNAGNATLLTATGTTGLSVTVDLSGFSGFTATQQLFDDGTNGDGTANDGTYSYRFTVPSSTAAQAYTLSFTGRNTATLTSNTLTTSLTVALPVAFTPIHTIQGNTPGTSAYTGQNVLTRGIVTSVISNGFYLQARDSDDDSDPLTSEGIFVFAGSGRVPTNVTVGTEVEVTGTVALYPTTSTMPGAEITSVSNYNVLGSGNTLPAPITLTTSDPSPSGGVAQLGYLQSMRVTAPSLTVTQPTDGTLTETAETYTSSGEFWAEVTGLPRPTREPGLDVRDAFTASQASTIPRFDSDPETFLVDSILTTTASNALNLPTNTVLTNVVGVMDLSNVTVPRLLIDAATRPNIGSRAVAVGVPAAGAGEMTIADQNMERFYNDVASDNAGAVTVTTAAYQLRLAKGSLGIRNILNTPDIIALEEMENLATLTDLSSKISSDAVAAGQTDPQYAPCLVQGSDPSGINVAFLTKPSKVNVLGCDQFGKTTTFTNAAGAQATLNDRPPLVLHAGIKRANGASDYPVTIIVNHLRSLNGVTGADTTAQTVRLKREKQAEYLANLVQGYQSAGEHVVVVGDFNAFDVNDGLVDSLGIIKGNPAPASQDVLAGPSGLVSPVLVDAAPTDVPNGAYSYVFSGYAQSIDHFLVTQDIASIIRTVPAHWNADFPAVYRNDATRPEAASDHDGIVGYLSVPAPDAAKAVLTTPAPGSTLTDSTVTFTWTPGTNVAQYVLYVGRQPGGLDLYAGNPVYTTSQTISGLPNDGSTIYVRLFSYINGGYQYNDYTYTTYTQTSAKAVITSPAPGSTLPGTTTTFTWTTGTRVAQYVVYVGNQPGGNDIYSGTPVYTTSLTVNNLPNDGRTVYVRLWSYVDGGYQYNDYTYTAYAPASAKAVITSPAPGSTLTGSTATFTWTPGTRVAQYVLYVGTQPGGLDIYSGNPVYTTSQTVSGLPTDGSTIYVRLWSYIDGGYQYNDYTYTAGGSAQ